MVSKAKLILSIVLIGFGIYMIGNFVNSYNNLIIAEKNLGYEYGRCVFYDQISVEKCNAMAPNGFEFYEKYYGDGSWTVEADPKVD